MKLKLDEQGHVVVVEGKPVYVHDDGKEIPFDAVQAMGKISSLNGEAKTNRERAETAEAGLKAFEGLSADDARKAIDTVSKLDQKTLVDAGKVDEVRNEITKVFEGRLAESKKATEKLEAQLRQERIGGSFARSKLIAEKLAIPADMVEARFGSAFRLEDNKVVAYGADGNKIFSRTRPGEIADFDEALESLIEQYPNRDHILKPSGANGGGANGGERVRSGDKSINRAAFDGMSPADQAAHLKGGGSITD